jgi:putative transposase
MRWPTKGVSNYRRTPDADHVHMCIAISPKHRVASVIGFLKGKSAIAIARLCGKERNFTGEHLWARGYAVSTVGFELD